MLTLKRFAFALSLPRPALPRPALPRPALPRLPTLAAMHRAFVTRRQLAAMDDRMLRDIGISRADALHEAERRPWDLGRV